MKKSIVLLVSGGLFTLALTFGIVAKNATTLNELGAKAEKVCEGLANTNCQTANGDVYSNAENI